MKRIGNLFKKDIILGIKDVFILLELGFAVFIVLLLLFVIPENIEKDKTAYIYDATTLVKNFVHSTAESAEAQVRKGSHYVDSREEVIKGMEEDELAIGLIITEKKNGTYRVEFLTQPYTKNSIVQYVEVEMEDLMSILKPPGGIYPPDVYKSVKVSSLQQGLRDELPFNLRLLPTILMYMVGILGLFAMVSLIGQERSDATIRALRVSPASMWEFLISKHLLLLATGFATFSILYLPMMGFGGYPEALLLIILTILMGSSIGVILGGLFDSPIGAILWVLLLMIVLSLPAISLFSPSFSPQWLKLIPSYHTLFGLDAVMFPDNNRHIIWQGVSILAVIDVILFAFSGLIFNKLIRKEA